MFNIRVLILFFCFAILNATSGYSNDIIRCSAAEVFKRNAAKNPVLLLRKQQQELAFQQWLLNKQAISFIKMKLKIFQISKFKHNWTFSIRISEI